MSVTPVTDANADSCTQHQQINGIAVGISPMTDQKEIKDIFKVNLLDKGLLPILLVVEDRSPSASFVVAKERIAVLSETGKTNIAAQRKDTSSASTGTAVGLTGSALMLASPAVGAPLVLIGLKMGSDATVIQYNLANKEFYSRTLGPGEKAQGFVYFEFTKESATYGHLPHRRRT